ncbi:7 transmembrane receptor [Teladorsagia circumcincta]|uniref:7 transmembrane receptor n=1 Tax=Teladorsagia circumcincta TaxID=45464 RepID=A0A2G9UQF7_TELCI|nr:7 transmembrane receptor [Teladorsagia circumcincta]
MACQALSNSFISRRYGNKSGYGGNRSRNEAGQMPEPAEFIVLNSTHPPTMSGITQHSSVDWLRKRTNNEKGLILRMSNGDGAVQLNIDGVGEMPAVEWMMLHHMAIILLTVVGNCLLVYVILKNNAVRRRKRVTPVQMLMLHMCAADLLFALITMVPTMAITATVPVFYGPDMLCRFVKFLQVIPMYASSFLLVAISADRFQAICRPFASMKTNAYKRPALYASVAWVLALLFSTPQFGLFAKIDDDCVGTYTSAYQYAVYVTVFNTVVWLLPSALAGYLYYRVCKAVWQSTTFGSAFPTIGKTDQLSPMSSSAGQVHHRGATMQCVELDRRRVQTVKLTLTIVAANFILWAPFCITSDLVWAGCNSLRLVDVGPVKD